MCYPIFIIEYKIFTHGTSLTKYILLVFVDILKKKQPVLVYHPDEDNLPEGMKKRPEIRQMSQFYKDIVKNL